MNLVKDNNGKNGHDYLPLQLIITPHQSQPYIRFHNLILFILFKGCENANLNVCQFMFGLFREKTKKTYDID